jgi:CRP-like cAMP-binding protein
MKEGVRFTLSITDIPEALALARRELAKILRERADEGPCTPDELRAIAALLEAGQMEE